MQPIDLQTLFSQIDKVARNQMQQREGLQIQAALQQVQSQKKAEEHIRAVNEAQNMGDGTSQIKDEDTREKNPHNGRGNGGEGSSGKSETEPRPRNLFIRDPALGRNIDISG
jgi:hypothetical protein